MGPASDPSKLSEDSQAFRFPKLNGQNYTLWAGYMKSSLQARYLWLLVNGLDVCPAVPASRPENVSEHVEKADRKEYMEWMQRDQAAQGLMLGAAETSQWPHVKNKQTAKEIWDTWEELYVRNQQRIDVHYYFEELYTRKYADGSSMPEHIASILDLGQRITAAGETLPDIHVARAMVLSLPREASWDLIKIQLFSLDSSKLTTDHVGAVLIGEHNRCEREKASETALLATKPKSGKKGKRGQKLDDDECRLCHEKGHWANKCPNREPKKATTTVAASTTVAPAGSANHMATLQNLGAHEVGQLYMVQTLGTGSTNLILDCGATSHMFCDRQFFEKYTSTSGEYVSVGDARNIPVVGRGSVKFKCRLPNGYREVTLHLAMHVPSLAANLVSLGQLQRQGITYASCTGGISLRQRGDELFRASLAGSTGTLYHIECLGRSNEAMFMSTSGSLRVWHRRLGHINLDAIREMAKKNLVNGLQVSSMDDFDRVCEGCVIGKSHRLSFPNTSITQYAKLDVLAVDLTGPMSAETWTGMRYALVAVDVATRFPVGRLLHSKKDAAKALCEIISTLERQSGSKLKRLRCDNGREFINEEINELCSRNGIIIETMVPYTPEQNGIVERAIAVLFEMVRCMLHSSKMDLRYWGEAFMYAVYIRSCSYTLALKDKVPFEAWYGRKPDISHIRMFGSVTYVNIPKKLRGGKLEVTSVKCRLLGWWADETKGYRL